MANELLPTEAEAALAWKIAEAWAAWNVEAGFDEDEPIVNYYGAALVAISVIGSAVSGEEG